MVKTYLILDPKGFDDGMHGVKFSPKYQGPVLMVMMESRWNYD
jgi:hypothetical protein